MYWQPLLGNKENLGFIFYVQYVLLGYKTLNVQLFMSCQTWFIFTQFWTLITLQHVIPQHVFIRMNCFHMSGQSWLRRWCLPTKFTAKYIIIILFFWHVDSWTNSSCSLAPDGESGSSWRAACWESPCIGWSIHTLDTGCLGTTPPDVGFLSERQIRSCSIYYYSCFHALLRGGHLLPAGPQELLIYLYTPSW